MQPVGVKVKPFDKTAMQETLTIPVGKSRESVYPFQWLLFKPQAHAIHPFPVNEPARTSNTMRSETRSAE
jgi:hypothetical protein